MRTGRDLLVLVRHAKIEDIESHIATEFEMRASALGSIMEAVLGASLGSLAALAVAAIESDGEDAGRRLIAAGLLVGVAGFWAFYGTLRRHADLRSQMTWAKDLAGRLRQVYGDE